MTEADEAFRTTETFPPTVKKSSSYRPNSLNQIPYRTVESEIRQVASDVTRDVVKAIKASVPEARKRLQGLVGHKIEIEVANRKRITILVEDVYVTLKRNYKEELHLVVIFNKNENYDMWFPLDL